MGLLIAGILLWIIGKYISETCRYLSDALDSLKFIEYEDPCKCEENGGGK